MKLTVLELTLLYAYHFFDLAIFEKTGSLKILRRLKRRLGDLDNGALVDFVYDSYGELIQDIADELGAKTGYAKWGYRFIQLGEKRIEGDKDGHFPAYVGTREEIRKMIFDVLR